MNPFEKHQIKHLSASSLNQYQAEPAVWTLKYLFKNFGDVGPAAWRGKAVEAGLDSWLYKKDDALALNNAAQAFEHEAQGDLEDDTDKERQNVAPMLQQARDGCSGLPVPTGRQFKVEHWLEGIEVPIIGYADYLFEDHILDLKTTLRCPSSIESASMAHKRQVAIYMAARKQPGRLLYVTPKKYAQYDVTQEIADEALADTTRIARALRTALDRSDDAQHMAELHAPDYQSFYWDTDLIQAAGQVRAWA